MSTKKYLDIRCDFCKNFACYGCYCYGGDCGITLFCGGKYCGKVMCASCSHTNFLKCKRCQDYAKRYNQTRKYCSCDEFIKVIHRPELESVPLVEE